MRLGSAAALGLLLASPAYAGRILPADGKVGSLRGHDYPTLAIDGQTYRLAPGGRVYDDWNRIILPTAMPSSARVFYRLDSRGEVIQLWLLTPEEESRLAR